MGLPWWFLGHYPALVAFGPIAIAWLSLASLTCGLSPRLSLVACRFAPALPAPALTAIPQPSWSRAYRRFAPLACSLTRDSAPRYRAQSPTEPRTSISESDPINEGSSFASVVPVFCCSHSPCNSGTASWRWAYTRANRCQSNSAGAIAPLVSDGAVSYGWLALASQRKATKERNCVYRVCVGAALAVAREFSGRDN